VKSHAVARTPSSITTWYSSGLSSPPLTNDCLITWPSNSASLGNADRLASQAAKATAAAAVKPMTRSARPARPCVNSQNTPPKYRIGPKIMARMTTTARGHGQVVFSTESCCQLPR
jgi:hypothetical protein